MPLLRAPDLVQAWPSGGQTGSRAGARQGQRADSRRGRTSVAKRVIDSSS
jgi:hypothetical protein